MRIISPPPEDFPHLRSPLQKGERKVFEFLNTYLPEDWEIYLQPHLNGLRPDFVLICPKVGIAILEVKDWNLNDMRYFNRQGELWASKDNKEFWYEDNNPIPKLRYYKEELFNLEGVKCVMI